MTEKGVEQVKRIARYAYLYMILGCIMQIIQLFYAFHIFPFIILLAFMAIIYYNRQGWYELWLEQHQEQQNRDDE